jgi:hypothetical protein
MSAEEWSHGGEAAVEAAGESGGNTAITDDVEPAVETPAEGAVEPSEGEQNEEAPA